MAFGAAKVVLFIEVSSLQGVLIRGVPLYNYIAAHNSADSTSTTCTMLTSASFSELKKDVYTHSTTIPTL